MKTDRLRPWRIGGIEAFGLLRPYMPDTYCLFSNSHFLQSFLVELADPGVEPDFLGYEPNVTPVHLPAMSYLLIIGYVFDSFKVFLFFEKNLFTYWRGSPTSLVLVS